MNFELRCVAWLSRRWHGLRVAHSGRRGDGGVDFFGEWQLGERRVAVLGQCKGHARKLGAAAVREFGAVLGKEDLGVLVASGGFSRDAVAEAHVQGKPLVLVELGQEEGSEARQIVMARGVEKLVAGLGVGTVLHEGRREPIVLWQGKPLENRQ